MRPLIIVTVLASLAACGTGDGVAPTTDATSDTPLTDGPTCPWDDSTDADSAVGLFEGSPTTGYLCPEDDADWYAVSVPPGEGLLTVSLAIDGELSPVQPTYAIFAAESGDEGDDPEAVAAPPAALIGKPLEVVHCIAPGDYHLVVRDHNDDGQDVYRGYDLAIATAPDLDGSEPNGDASLATPLASGATVDGWASCRGDEDWFVVDVPDGQFLRIELTADVPEGGGSTWQPLVRVLSAEGDSLASETNPGVGATAIDTYVVLPEGGLHYVVVSDNDGLDADPDLGYALTVHVLEDLDVYEPNPNAAQATELATAPPPCAPGTWTDWIERSGTIGAEGDVDWFRLPIQGCDPGVIEAELELDLSLLSDPDAWLAQSTVQASLAYIRADPLSACDEDAGCFALDRECGSSWDCAGVFNVCLPEGQCAGSGACLPEGDCGAIVVEKHYTAQSLPLSVTEPPPPNRVVVSAPVFGGEALWLKVSDYQSNGAAPDVLYTLRVRIMGEPDLHEPSNVYSPDLPKGFPVKIQQPMSTDVPVHECVLPKEPTPVSKGECCTDETWIEGTLSYENDQDWYRYVHPCPGEDCMVRVLFQLDGGPVDHLINIYRGKNLWFDTLTQLEEFELQQPLDAHFGGLEETDKCFYAYQSHVGNPFYYYLQLRDLAATHDWDPGQGYRFCVEKVSHDCESPCRRYTDGCGTK